MVIERVAANKELDKLIDGAFLQHTSRAQIVDFNHHPFTFVAREGTEILGAINGWTIFNELYIDRLIVLEKYRGQNIGSQLIQTVEDHYRDSGLHNMNLCTYAFQAPRFYEKLGFKLEFMRPNPQNPALDKYYYVKFF